MTGTTSGPTLGDDVLAAVRAPVDRVLGSFLGDRRAELASLDPEAALLVDEISRLVRAGGARLRPAVCIWAFRCLCPPSPEPPDRSGDHAAVGEPIVRAASALELLHTMALIHDDVMDESPTRRGVASSPSHLAGVAAERRYPASPDRVGRSAAILAGDLALVLADRLFLDSGFDPGVVVRGLAPFHEMRVRMAAGQLLDVAGLADAPARARIAARLKGGSYTVEGPVEVAAALAAADGPALEALRAYARPLGEAFQLRDDLEDRDRPVGVDPDEVDGLVADARAALRDAPLDPAGVAALDAIAETVATR